MHWTHHRALQTIAKHRHQQLDDQMDEAVAIASVCPMPGCPRLQPCTLHQRNPMLTRNPQRDLAQHQRQARAAKKRTPYCERCGSTEKLDAHHPVGIQHPLIQVLCNDCHVLTDPHARKR